MKKFQILVSNDVGLHARPASVFVQAAKQFKAKITIRNVTTNSLTADVKSILSVLVLGIERNHTVEIEANGEDEEQAMDCLNNLIKSNFQ
jgi:phosphocarrier protein HPr